MKTLNLVKNWGYDINPNDENPESDGHFALAKIDKKAGTATSKLTDREDYIKQFNYGTFYHCREVFHKVFTEKDKSILYVHAGNLGETIEKFIHLVEELLNIPNKEKSQFFKTQRTTITPIRPAKFWLACPMKRQVFSLLLRSGRNFDIVQDNNNIWPALKSSKNTKSVIPALEVFLGGHTKFDQKCLDILKANHHHGFCHIFSNKSPDEIKNIWLFKE